MFFGLVCIRAWNYWWGYTSAQIDLMIADGPIIVYHNKNKVKKHSKAEMDALVEQWKRKRAEQEARGEKINLNSFLGSSQKKG